MMRPVVRLSDVRREFGPVTVLGGIGLEAEPGQVVALYGRSGSGKTTLLNLIGGLDRPTGGRVEVEGQDLAGLAPSSLDELRRTRLAFIFQSYGLLAHLSARDNVTFALRLAGCPRALWRERQEEALDWVGLTRRAHHRPGELSGGERQRVAVARALAVRPRLLLADEPTGAVDHATGLQVAGLLTRFARESGACIFIATHDLSFRSQVDLAYRITEGRLSPVAEVTA
jgi:putative ABC transport system ATP-binding protein